MFQFVAVYDYEPSAHHVESSAPAPLLPFSAGDVIVTDGNVRADGFYSAKVPHTYRKSMFVASAQIVASLG